jgi:DNA-binding NarL/FixJ family response regulator
VTIRVFIADDHGVLRGGLRALVHGQADMEVVGEAADGVDAETGILETDPDVVVMDISMPRRGGIETIVAVKQKRPETRILVLTVHEEQGFVRAAFAAGAVGYVLKTAVDTELIAAVRSAATGEATGSSAEAVPIPRPSEPGLDAPIDVLSDREREVICLIANGYTNRETADQLALSVKSVETYRARSMAKLGLQTRADLVRYALERGLLRAPAR